MNDKEVTKISKILSDPIRYEIIRLLIGKGESAESLICDHPGVCNCEIMAKFNMIQSRVSYHMKEMVDAGLVWEKPQGKWKYYALNKDTLRSYLQQLEKEFNL